MLVPASCVNGVERLGIGIRGAGSQLLFSNGTIFKFSTVFKKVFPILVGVQRVFTYPDFIISQDRGNNVAVVKVWKKKKNKKFKKY